MRGEKSGVQTRIRNINPRAFYVPCSSHSLNLFKFICSIVIWYKILSRINPISKLLQTVHFDISQAIDTLNNCKLFFENLRSDEAFESIILEVTELASEVDVEANFEATTPHLKQKYKIELFFHTVDQAINALETRYNLLNTHSNYFSFLYNIFGLKDMRRNELLAYCKDLEVVLTDGNSSDLNALELADEISIVSSLLTKETPVGGL
ncbi:hypothetical protein RN001_012754 [Aquatica leii]|uniref:Uncharacterized protein n=1 Tax=Aquatica leii TaxID=1421715 RepID=A0AAN7SDH0_9COLE|nr:hypothetical protein RN001_012754 [Aquatica leii]